MIFSKTGGNCLVQHENVLVKPHSLNHGTTGSKSIDISQHNKGQFEFQVAIKTLVFSKIDIRKRLISL